MQPGLSRAIPMAILGFLIGMGLLMVLRALQSLQPVLDTQLALVMGTLFCAGFFVWGMGAFDPKMNEHAHEPGTGEEQHAVVPHVEAHEEETPTRILGGYMWLLATLLLVLLLVIAVFALTPGGVTLQTVGTTAGNVSALGHTEVAIDDQTFLGLARFGVQDFYFSKLAVLAGFIVFMFASLAVAAGGLGLAMNALARGAASAKAAPATSMGYGVVGRPTETMTPQTPTVLLYIVIASIIYLLVPIVPLPAPTPIDFAITLVEVATVALLMAISALITIGLRVLRVGSANMPEMLRFFVVFTIITVVLYPLFYHLLIGLALPGAPFLGILSFQNTLIVALLLTRPKGLSRLIGRVAAWLAHQLRRLPNALQ